MGSYREDQVESLCGLNFLGETWRKNVISGSRVSVICVFPRIHANARLGVRVVKPLLLAGNGARLSERRFRFGGVSPGGKEPCELKKVEAASDT